MQLKFMAEISLFEPEMIIWVDETVSARRNAVRSYGYSLKGMRAVSHELRVSGMLSLQCPQKELRTYTSLKEM